MENVSNHTSFVNGSPTWEHAEAWLLKKGESAAARGAAGADLDGAGVEVDELRAAGGRVGRARGAERLAAAGCAEQKHKPCHEE